jgi:hypothetical protein
MHYLGGKVETLEEIINRNDPKDRILISNLKSAQVNNVWVSTVGWKWTTALREGDIVHADA